MTTNHGLQKIDSRGIGDEITIQLVQLVTNSEPGTRLPTERELSDMLNVSRSSIREAVRSLAFVGAVRALPGLLVRRRHDATLTRKRHYRSAAGTRSRRCRPCSAAAHRRKP